MNTCALCRNKETLKESHIVPKFVTEWIKKTGLTGFLRNSENDYKKREQDGIKQYLLCERCEGLFSKVEKKFAENIFIPYLRNSKEEFEYQEWLRYFITSVNWRVLYLEIMDYLNQEREISPSNIEKLTNTAQCLGNYLLGKEGYPNDVESHIYFINDLAFIAQADLRPVSFFKRSVFTSLIESDSPMEYCYVYTNLSGILIVTVIKKTSHDIWKDTLVTIEGKLGTKQLMGSPVLGDLVIVLEQANEGGVPEYQATKILEQLMKRDEQELERSKFVEEFIKDQDLQELYRKLFKEE